MNQGHDFRLPPDRLHQEEQRFRRHLDVPVLREYLRVLARVGRVADAEVVEKHHGNWQKARELLQESLNVSEKVGSEQLSKVASTNLGNTLWKLGDWVSALQYYKLNLALSESEGDLWDLVTAYNNVGNGEAAPGLQYAERFAQYAIFVAGKIDDAVGDDHESVELWVGCVAGPEGHAADWHLLLHVHDTLLYHRYVPEGE